MFSVYGVTGQVYRGRLEGLYQVPGVPASRHVRAIAREGDELGAEAGPVEALETPPATTSEALRAYRDARHADLDRGPLVRAAQVMQREVLIVHAADSVESAWQTLGARQVRQCPVLGGDGGLVGIVSERDLLTALNVEAGRLRDVLSRRVADVMHTPVVCAEAQTDIRRIASIMVEGRVDGVPVVGDAGQLLGFVSRTDILAAVMRDPPLSLWR